MPLQIEYTETLTVTTCWCGIKLAVPDNLLRWAQESRNNPIYCPIGHTFVFHNSFEEKLKQEQQRHQATRDLLTQEERSHSATKGQLTKTKKRVAKGVCPCCKRHFTNVERHMASQHPEYAPEAA